MEVKEIIIEGERIFLKKSKIFGWSVIYPFKIDEKINWFNILTGGSWIKLAITIVFIIIVLLCIYDYYSAIKIATDCLNTRDMFRIII